MVHRSGSSTLIVASKDANPDRLLETKSEKRTFVSDSKNLPELLKEFDENGKDLLQQTPELPPAPSSSSFVVNSAATVSNSSANENETKSSAVANILQSTRSSSRFATNVQKSSLNENKNGGPENSKCKTTEKLLTGNKTDEVVITSSSRIRSGLRSCSLESVNNGNNGNNNRNSNEESIVGISGNYESSTANTELFQGNKKLKKVKKKRKDTEAELPKDTAEDNKEELLKNINSLSNTTKTRLNRTATSLSDTHSKLPEKLTCSLPLDRLSGFLDTILSKHANLESKSMKKGISEGNISTITSGIASGTAEGSSVGMNDDCSSSQSHFSSVTAKSLCLYCDKKFSSHKVRIKHTERIHAIAKGRRISSRNLLLSSSKVPSPSLSSSCSSLKPPIFPGCSYCCFNSNKLKTVTMSEDLKQLFYHLVDYHSDKYFGCKLCVIRFISLNDLEEHIATTHKLLSHSSTERCTRSRSLSVTKRNKNASVESNSTKAEVSISNVIEISNVSNSSSSRMSSSSSIGSTSRSSSSSTGGGNNNGNGTEKQALLDENSMDLESTPTKSRRRLKQALENKSLITTTRSSCQNVLVNDETILSRLGVAQNRLPRGRKGIRNRRLCNVESVSIATTATISTGTTTTTATITVKSSTVDTGLQGVKNRSKVGRVVTSNITMDSTESSLQLIPRPPTSNRIEALSSCTFDEDFYENVSVNVRENLCYHLDGKLENDPNPPSHLSPLATVPAIRSTVVKSPLISESEIHEATALSTVTAFPTLLTAEQYGCDLTNAAKMRKPITKHSWKWKWDCVKKYKYVNEGGKIVKKVKQPMIGLRDLSKLDMWTQLTMRTKHEIAQRQDNETLGRSDVGTIGESSREEKRKQITQLNTILDTRRLPQIILEQNEQTFIKIEIPEDSNLTGPPSPVCNNTSISLTPQKDQEQEQERYSEISFTDYNDFVQYLNLNRFDSHSTSTDEDIVLSGEWARPRCYVCFGCGAKFDKLKTLEEHKMFRHPYVYSTHYEIVGRELIEGNLYKHFYIPTKALHKHKEYRMKIAKQQHGASNNIMGSNSGTNCISGQGKIQTPENSPCCEESMDSVASVPISCSTTASRSDFENEYKTTFVSTSSSLTTASLEIEEESLLQFTGKFSGKCTKCNRDCHGVLELYRHMLDCSGDYAWILAKKRKYRYFGAKRRKQSRQNLQMARRERTASIRRDRGKTATNTTNDPNDEVTPQKTKNNSGTPRPPRPSDAESIRRMLENLPPKRTCRQIIPNVTKPGAKRKVGQKVGLKRGILMKGKVARKTKAGTIASTTVTAITKNILRSQKKIYTTRRLRQRHGKKVQTKSPILLRKRGNKSLFQEDATSTEKCEKEKESPEANLMNNIGKKTKDLVRRIKQKLNPNKTTELPKKRVTRKNVKNPQVPSPKNGKAREKEEENIEENLNNPVESKVVPKKRASKIFRKLSLSKVMKKDKEETKTSKESSEISESVDNSSARNEGKITPEEKPSDDKKSVEIEKETPAIPVKKRNLKSFLNKFKDKSKTKLPDTENSKVSKKEVNLPFISVENSANNEEEETKSEDGINFGQNKPSRSKFDENNKPLLLIPSKSDSKVCANVTQNNTDDNSKNVVCSNGAEPLNLTVPYSQPILQVSPTTKRRGKKLNDCIAMLTGKLQEKLGKPFFESNENLDSALSALSRQSSNTDISIVGEATPTIITSSRENNLNNCTSKQSSEDLSDQDKGTPKSGKRKTIASRRIIQKDSSENNTPSQIVENLISTAGPTDNAKNFSSKNKTHPVNLEMKQNISVNTISTPLKIPNTDLRSSQTLPRANDIHHSSKMPQKSDIISVPSFHCDSMKNTATIKGRTISEKSGIRQEPTLLVTRLENNQIPTDLSLSRKSGNIINSISKSLLDLSQSAKPSENSFGPNTFGIATPQYDKYTPKKQSAGKKKKNSIEDCLAMCNAIAMEKKNMPIVRNVSNDSFLTSPDGALNLSMKPSPRIAMSTPVLSTVPIISPNVLPLDKTLSINPSSLMTQTALPAMHSENRMSSKEFPKNCKECSSIHPPPMTTVDIVDAITSSNRTSHSTENESGFVSIDAIQNLSNESIKNMSTEKLITPLPQRCGNFVNTENTLRVRTAAERKAMKRKSPDKNILDYYKNPVINVPLSPPENIQSSGTPLSAFSVMSPLEQQPLSELKKKRSARKGSKADEVPVETTCVILSEDQPPQKIVSPENPDANVIIPKEINQDLNIRTPSSPSQDIPVCIPWKKGRGRKRNGEVESIQNTENVLVDNKTVEVLAPNDTKCSSECEIPTVSKNSQPISSSIDQQKPKSIEQLKLNVNIVVNEAKVNEEKDISKKPEIADISVEKRNANTDSTIKTVGTPSSVINLPEHSSKLNSSLDSNVSVNIVPCDSSTPRSVAKSNTALGQKNRFTRANSRISSINKDMPLLLPEIMRTEDLKLDDGEGKLKMQTRRSNRNKAHSVDTKEGNENVDKTQLVPETREIPASLLKADGNEENIPVDQAPVMPTILDCSEISMVESDKEPHVETSPEKEIEKSQKATNKKKSFTLNEIRFTRAANKNKNNLKNQLDTPKEEEKESSKVVFKELYINLKGSEKVCQEYVKIGPKIPATSTALLSSSSEALVDQTKISPRRNIRRKTISTISELQEKETKDTKENTVEQPEEEEKIVNEKKRSPSPPVSKIVPNERKTRTSPRKAEEAQSKLIEKKTPVSGNLNREENTSTKTTRNNNKNSSVSDENSVLKESQNTVESTEPSSNATAKPNDKLEPGLKKQRRRRRNELAAIVADQLLESFKEVDKSRIDDLKMLENLAYEKSEDLLLTGMRLTPTTKRKIVSMDKKDTKKTNTKFIERKSNNENKKEKSVKTDSIGSGNDKQIPETKSISDEPKNRTGPKNAKEKKSTSIQKPVPRQLQADDLSRNENLFRTLPGNDEPLKLHVDPLAQKQNFRIGSNFKPTQFEAMKTFKASFDTFRSLTDVSFTKSKEIQQKSNFIPGSTETSNSVDSQSPQGTAGEDGGSRFEFSENGEKLKKTLHKKMKKKLTRKKERKCENININEVRTGLELFSLERGRRSIENKNSNSLPLNGREWQKSLESVKDSKSFTTTATHLFSANDNVSMKKPLLRPSILSAQCLEKNNFPKDPNFQPPIEVTKPVSSRDPRLNKNINPPRNIDKDDATENTDKRSLSSIRSKKKTSNTNLENLSANFMNPRARLRSSRRLKNSLSDNNSIGKSGVKNSLENQESSSNINSGNVTKTSLDQQNELNQQSEESSDDDDYLSQIAKSVNDRILSSDDEGDGFDLATPDDFLLSCGNRHPPRPSTSMSLRSMPNFDHDRTRNDFLNDDDNTNTEIIDMDLEDDISVYTSFSQDVSRFTRKGGRFGQRRRRRRRSLLFTRRPKKTNILDMSLEFRCDICNKVFRKAMALTKHRMTISHISKLSAYEYFHDMKRKESMQESSTAAPPVEDIHAPRNEKPVVVEHPASGMIQGHAPLEEPICEPVEELVNEGKAAPAMPVETEVSKAVSSTECGEIRRTKSLPSPSLSSVQPIPTSTSSLNLLNQSGIEPISSPEQADANYERYQNSSSRIALSQEERLFYECCNMLKGSETPLVERTYPVIPSTYASYDVSNKPVTPRSSERFSYLGSEAVGNFQHGTAYTVKSPMSQSRNSPRHAYPKINVNQFSDISSDSNPAFTRTQPSNTSLHTNLNLPPKCVLPSTNHKYPPFIQSPLREMPVVQHSVSVESRAMIRDYQEEQHDLTPSHIALNSDRLASSLTARTFINERAPIKDYVPTTDNINMLPADNNIEHGHLPSTITQTQQTFTSPLHSTSSQGSTVTTTTCRMKTKAAMKGYDNFKISIPTLGLDMQHALERNPHSGCKLTALAEIALGSEAPLETHEKYPLPPPPTARAESVEKPKIKAQINEKFAKKYQDLIKSNISPITPKVLKGKDIMDRTGNKLGFKVRKNKTKPKNTSDVTPVEDVSKPVNAPKPKDVYEFDDSNDVSAVCPRQCLEEAENVKDLINLNSKQSEKIVIPERPFKDIGLDVDSEIKFTKPLEVTEQNDESSLSTTSYSDRDDFNYGSMNEDDEDNDRSDEEITNKIEYQNNKTNCAEEDRRKTEISSDSDSDSSARTTKTIEQKCLIMGRIFKNATKNRANENLQEKTPTVETKKKIPTQELDKLFDKLREQPEKESLVEESKTSVVNHQKTNHIKEFNAEQFSMKKDEPEKIAECSPILQKKTSMKKPDQQKSETVSKQSNDNNQNDKNFAVPEERTSCESGVKTTVSGENKIQKKRSSRLNRKDSTQQQSKEIYKLQSELGMSAEEIAELIGEGQRKSQRRCAANRPKKVVEIWSSDEYEDFLSTKDIIALIEEKEKRSRKRKGNLKNGTEKKNSDTLKSSETTSKSKMENSEDRKKTSHTSATLKEKENSKTSDAFLEDEHKDQENISVAATKKQEKRSSINVEEKSITKSYNNNNNDEAANTSSSSPIKDNRKLNCIEKVVKTTNSQKKPTLSVRPRLKNKNEDDSESDFEKEWRLGVTSKSKIKKRRKTISFKEQEKLVKSLDDDVADASVKTFSATPSNKVKDQKLSQKGEVDLPKKSSITTSNNTTENVVSAASGRPLPRRKRIASEMLYYWSSSSSDEDFGRIENRDDDDDDDIAPEGEHYQQHGWIVGDSHKKLVTLLAIAKGKKAEDCGVKETGHKKKA